MRRAGRIRRVLKWGGVVISSVVTVAWAVSLYCGFGHSKNDITIAAVNGHVVCVCVAAIGKSTDGGWFVDRSPASSGSFTWLPGVERRALAVGVIVVYHLPLWMPLLLIAVPTTILFWRDRRRIPPGCCRVCGYDLTGNTSGVCPECGAGINRSPASEGG